jgi:hypothetical protein
MVPFALAVALVVTLTGAGDDLKGAEDDAIGAEEVAMVAGGERVASKEDVSEVEVRVEVARGAATAGG